MVRARKIAQILCPNVEIVFAQVTLQHDQPMSMSQSDISVKIDRTVQDLREFQVPRPLPLVMDVLTAVDLKPEDIFIFTNVDIALAPNFYEFINSVFERGIDCAIVNRRTISDVYCDERDLSLMTNEVGAPHPGFDCFAYLGSLKNRLTHYDSCVGIAGVMAPLVYQLLAKAKRPVVLLDAHATFHLGDDKEWKNDKFKDYSEHNLNEIHTVFNALLDDVEQKQRLLDRLTGEHGIKVIPRGLRGKLGVKSTLKRRRKPMLQNGFYSKVRSLLRR